MTNRTPFFAALIVFLTSGHAVALSLSDDYRSMMEWLTNESVEGLAFCAGYAFDPPSELVPWKLQPDVSLGVGVVPMNKSKFPGMTVPALSDLDPAQLFPSHIMFPDLAFHMRLGLPGRWDVSGRGANMTVPDGYRLTPATKGGGQSNSFGFSVRRHFMGGELPMVSVMGNYNHVLGHFDFRNQFQNLAMTPTYIVDVQNSGQMAWDVTSIGFNAVVSHTFGIWTPFVGAGFNRMSGSVRGRLESNFADELSSPAAAEASNRPQQHQTRAIFGVQLDRSRLSVFVNGEIKTTGAAAGKTFVVSSGLVAPFGFGAGNVAKKSNGSENFRRLAYEPLSELYLYPPSRKPSKKQKTQQQKETSDLIMIR